MKVGGCTGSPGKGKDPRQEVVEEFQDQGVVAG